jgi:hypothetical protein
MRLSSLLIPFGFLLVHSAAWFLAPTHAQDSLPVVDKGELVPLLANCERLLQTLDATRGPLPEATRQALRTIVKTGPQDAEALEKVQKLLDPHCLVGVTINPESRVKAARGPAPAHLVQQQDTVFLVKVHNEAGVTQRLALTSPHLLGDGAGEDRWLSATVYAKPPMPEKLSGHEVEYVLLVLSSPVAGKREAKLIFDVGQGTQDLGFRAEVPILFTIKAKKP